MLPLPHKFTHHCGVITDCKNFEHMTIRIMSGEITNVQIFMKISEMVQRLK
jgi:hypothetical protein